MTYFVSVAHTKSAGTVAGRDNACNILAPLCRNIQFARPLLADSMYVWNTCNTVSGISPINASCAGNEMTIFFFSFYLNLLRIVFVQFASLRANVEDKCRRTHMNMCWMQGNLHIPFDAAGILYTLDRILLVLLVSLLAQQMSIVRPGIVYSWLNYFYVKIARHHRNPAGTYLTALLVLAETIYARIDWYFVVIIRC